MSAQIQIPGMTQNRPGLNAGVSRGDWQRSLANQAGMEMTGQNSGTLKKDTPNPNPLNTSTDKSKSADTIPVTIEKFNTALKIGKNLGELEKQLESIIWIFGWDLKNNHQRVPPVLQNVITSVATGDPIGLVGSLAYSLIKNSTKPQAPVTKEEHRNLLITEGVTQRVATGSDPWILDKQEIWLARSIALRKMLNLHTGLVKTTALLSSASDDNVRQFHQITEDFFAVLRAWGDREKDFYNSGSGLANIIDHLNRLLGRVDSFVQIEAPSTQPVK